MSVVEQLVLAERELAPLLARSTPKKFNRVVNVMTNHQRNQWARAGYPGLRQKDCRKPANFIPATKLLAKLKPNSRSD